MYDIILQNNASKEFFLLQGLEDEARTELYLEFNDVELPDDLPDGEYVYAVLGNKREDVTYVFNTPILDTIVQTEDGDVVLRDLQPFTGLLRVGLIVEKNVYDEDESNAYPYDDGRDENNDTIYYTF